MIRLRRGYGGRVRERLDVERWALSFGVYLNRNYVYLAFAETQRGFDCLDQSRAILSTDRDAILNDLHARTEAFNFWSASTRTIWLSIQTRR